jgi:hypothetical protein
MSHSSIFRITRSKPLLLIVLALPVFAATAAQKSYDGETLFRGFVFLEGDVAKEIKILNEIRRGSALDSLNSDQINAYNKTKTFIITFIRKYHPEFFDQFKAQIESGNPLIVDAALRHAGELLVESLFLKPLMILARADLRDTILTKKTQEALKMLAASKSVEELRERLKNDDLRNGLIINKTEWVVARPLDKQIAKDKFGQLDYLRFHNLDFAFARNLDLQLAKSKAFNAAFNKAFDKDIDLGAGNWFNKNENVNENVNVNVDRNVNIKEDVNVAIEAVFVVLLALEPVAGVDEQSQLLHEETIKEITIDFKQEAR